MDKELIKQIASQIINEQILLNWKFYLVIGSIYLVVYCLLSFIKPYLGKRGEALAKKSDLEGVLAEVRKTTELTENIKREIDAESWITKEFNVLRRQKLEELLLLLYEYKKHIETEMKCNIFQGLKSEKSDPSDHATAIHKLYFPELDEPMKIYYKSCAAWGTWLAEGLTQMQTKMANGQLPCVPEREHMDKYGQVLNEVYFAIKGVEDNAKLVMDKLRTI